MSDPQGIVTYPGLQTFTKAEYVLSQGISPGKCTIELPQELVDGLEPTGDLTITYADQTITLPNCLLDSAHIDQSEKGYIARVTILDRRWQWKFGAISGHYNIRMPGGANANEGFNSSSSNSQAGGNNNIRPGTEQAPQDLATLCLQAMGEQNYDVSALPNQPRPEIDWSWHNPAEGLQQLCEGLGCRVTYVVDSDSVAVVTVGQGNSLPDNGLQTFVSAGVNPPNTPSSLKLVGGPAVYQGFIPLEAVGIDTDGSIKPINDLTYTPPKGWANEDPDKFPNITDPNVRPLLEKSVYKMWRVALPIQVPNPPAGNANVITSINQIHLFDRLIETNWDPNDQGKTTPKKPEIWGNFYQQYAQARQTPSTTSQVYKHGLEVDADRMIIVTEDKLYTMATPSPFRAPSFQLERTSLRPTSRSKSPIQFAMTIPGSSTVSRKVWTSIPLCRRSRRSCIAKRFSPKPSASLTRTSSSMASRTTHNPTVYKTKRITICKRPPKSTSSKIRSMSPMWELCRSRWTA